MNILFNKEIKIENKMISKSSPVFIIAEAGVNHNGDMSIARELIDIACDAGVDAVKFQTFKASDLILSSVEKAPYQKITTSMSENQYDMLKRLEISKEQNVALQDYCQKKRIIFLSTPFEEKSLKELADLNLPAFKIAATDLTNIKFLRQVANLGKPIILSAGMCYLEEIRIALETIQPINKNVIVLQCTANYPIQDEEANLSAIKTLEKEFDILVGYSDHSQNIGAAPYAVALGAKVIEKHYTLDKSMEGPDHKASVTPKELVELVKEVRRVEKYLGNGIKIPTYSEIFTRKSLQKCLVALKPISKGELFSEENVTAKRTNGVGISAIYYDILLSKKASREYDVDDIIID